MTPPVPDEILPDPEIGEPTSIVVEKAGSNMMVRAMSRDYEVLDAKRLDEKGKPKRWLFLNKSGSKWGGDCKIALENYIRINTEKPKEGQILWEVDFHDDPYFQQYLRPSGDRARLHSCLGELFGGFCQTRVYDDDHYFSYGGGWGRGYEMTLIINWTMQSQAKLSSPNRPGYGVDLRLGVAAKGTAVARYWQERIEDYRSDSEGRRIHVGHHYEWRHTEREYVDCVQFALTTACAGEGYAAGQVVGMPDGTPAIWAVDGDSSDYQCNYHSPFFSVTQPDAKLIESDPMRIETHACLDPAFCMLLGHLCTSEFSARAIKKAFNPDFPHNPHNARYGFHGRGQPPAEPLIHVVQPYTPPQSFATTTTTTTTTMAYANQAVVVPMAHGEQQAVQQAVSVEAVCVDMPQDGSQGMQQATPMQAMPMGQAQMMQPQQGMQMQVPMQQAQMMQPQQVPMQQPQMMQPQQGVQMQQPMQQAQMMQPQQGVQMQVPMQQPQAVAVQQPQAAAATTGEPAEVPVQVIQG